jgi:hypothetical protein
MRCEDREREMIILGSANRLELEVIFEIQ